MIAQKFLLGSKNLVTHGMMRVDLWVNIMLYSDVCWIPCIPPHFFPMLLFRPASVRFCWSSLGLQQLWVLTAMTSVLHHQLTHTPSRKKLSASHPLIFALTGFYFIFVLWGQRADNHMNCIHQLKQRLVYLSIKLLRLFQRILSLETPDS